MGRPLVPARQAAARFGISVRRIRVYEEEGLIRPDRSGRQILLGPDDVEVIAVVERLRADFGLNVQAAALFLEMRDRLLNMQQRMEEMEREFEARLEEAGLPHR